MCKTSKQNFISSTYTANALARFQTETYETLKKITFETSELGLQKGKQKSFPRLQNKILSRDLNSHLLAKFRK